MTMKINKYKVSQELMNDINEWRYRANGLVVGQDLSFSQLSSISNWWLTSGQGVYDEKNNRLIALIRYVNGEDVFEVEKPKKWVVRSKNLDYHGYYYFIHLHDINGVNVVNAKYANEIALFWNLDTAFKFNSKEEAEKWTNPLMEAVEVEE